MYKNLSAALLGLIALSSGCSGGGDGRTSSEVAVSQGNLEVVVGPTGGGGCGILGCDDPGQICQNNQTPCTRNSQCCSGYCELGLGGVCINPPLRVSPSGGSSTVEVGKEGEALAFTVVNTGTIATGTLSCTSSSALFKVGPNSCNSALPIGGTCTCQVSFVPQGPGTFTGTLTVGGAPGGAVTANLTGTATGQPPRPPVLAIAPAVVAFGDVNAGETRSATFTVSNTGGSPSGSVSISLIGGGPFNITTNGCLGSLGDNQSCPVTVSFTPTGAGAVTGRVEASATPGGNVSAALTGNSPPPVTVVSLESQVVFSSLPVGATSRPRRVRLRNPGSIAIGALTVTVTGDDPADFVVASNDCATGIPPGQSCTVEIVFRPTGQGSRGGILRAVATGGGTTATVDVTLQALAQGELGPAPPAMPPIAADLPEGGMAARTDLNGGFMFFSWPARDVPAPEPSPLAIYLRRIIPAMFVSGIPPTAWPSLTSRRGDLAGGSFPRLLASTCAGLDTASTSARICAALLVPGSEDRRRVEQALGMTIPQLQEEVERPLQYWFFSQRHRGVPIEHKGLMALRVPGRQVVTLFGSLLRQFQVTNAATLAPAEALRLARLSLIGVASERLVDNAALAPGLPPPQLVLLPDRGSSSPVHPIRFAFRGRVAVAVGTTPHPVTYTVWADAATGALLQFAREFGEQAPPTPVWCRDPGESSVTASPAVCTAPDPVAPDSLSFENEFFLPMMRGTSSGTGLEEIQRNQPPPPYDHTQAICQQHQFRYENGFAHLNLAFDKMTGGGKFPPMPGALQVNVDVVADSNFANIPQLSLTFKAHTGACTDGSNATGGILDGTIIAHEMAHLATQHLQTAPIECSFGVCPVRNPNNRAAFHDYADGYAALLSKTPCIGGWVAKHEAVASNPGRPGGALDAWMAEACAKGAPARGLPRLLRGDDFTALGDLFPSLLAMPVSPAPFHLSIDRFPDHRMPIGPGKGEYSDGEMLGAAIWHTQEGMVSQASVVGGMPVWGRLNQAVWASGFTPAACPGNEPDCDRNLYRSSRELLLQLVNAWVLSAGQHSRNKVLAAFARAGFFLTPDVCFDADAATTDVRYCPGNPQRAGDAVVDIFDGQAADGEVHAQVRQREDDHVSWAQTDPPEFRIWTGPRYRFNGNNAVFASGADRICNDGFTVLWRFPGEGELDWKNALFPANSRFQAEYDSVPAGECYIERPMDRTLWDQLRTQAQTRANDQRARNLPVDLFKIEYKVVTFRSNGVGSTNPSAILDTIRDSTKPGVGQFGAFAIPASVFFIDEGAL